MLTSGPKVWFLLIASILAVLRAVPRVQWKYSSARVPNVFRAAYNWVRVAMLNFLAGDPHRPSSWTRRRTSKTNDALEAKASEGLSSIDGGAHGCSNTVGQSWGTGGLENEFSSSSEPISTANSPESINLELFKVRGGYNDPHKEQAADASDEDYDNSMDDTDNNDDDEDEDDNEDDNSDGSASVIREATDVMTRWGYSLRELLGECMGEDEPDWVASYATSTLTDVAGQGVSALEEEGITALLKFFWACTVVNKEDLAAAEAEASSEVNETTMHAAPHTSRLAARQVLYRAFSKDLASDSLLLGGRHWLDKDDLVMLRGQALVCQQPKYMAIMASLLRQPSRGLHLVMPTAHHFMQETLAAALAHSMGAKLLIADHRRLAAIRRTALEAGVPSKMLNRARVMSALLDLVQDASSVNHQPSNESSCGPYVVFLADKGRWLSQDETLANRLMQELQSGTSSTFFLLASGRDPNTMMLPASPTTDARVANSLRSASISGTESRLMSTFLEVHLQPPKDVEIRACWDRLIREEDERWTAARNMALLNSTLKQHNGHMVCPNLQAIYPLLCTEDFVNDGEPPIQQIVAAAVRVEAILNPRLEQHTSGPVVLSLRAFERAFAMVMGTSIKRPEIPDVSSAGGSSQVDGLDPRGDEHLGPDRFERTVMRNVISPADIGVTYDMIGSLHDTKEALRQCVTYPLKFPHLYSEGIAGHCVKGVLLFGPPGTGKTMLAKAVATEGGATFLSVDAGLINQKYSGESEKVVKAIFRVARELAPCVVYIDEVDSILGSRDSSNEPSWVTTTKTTLMQEWDGLRTTTDRVLVIASTNRPYALDQAVLRRLPRRILVDLPDAETREEILQAIMSHNRMAPEVDLSRLAKRLEGYTGSDVREICREAVARIAHEEARKLEQEGEGKVGLEALRSHRLRAVTNEDFSAAMQKLSKSVAGNSRELEKVRYWNTEFGEGSGR